MLAVYVGTASAVTPSCPADDGGQCINTWRANQPMSLPDTGDVLEPGWTGTTRYWHSTKYSGRGILNEARRYGLYVRWRVVDYSRITGWWYSLTNTTGAQCRLQSYDTPFIYAGALNTSAIYVRSRAHFACDIGFIWPATVTVYPDCWLDMRYGAHGVSAVQTRGCDWV